MNQNTFRVQRLGGQVFILRESKGTDRVVGTFTEEHLRWTFGIKLKEGQVKKLEIREVR